MLRFSSVLAGVSVMFFSTLASARTINVPGDEPTVGAAIAAALKGDEVVVAPGTYPEFDLEIARGITLRSTDPSDDAVVAATIIDGCSAGRILTIKNRLQVATIEGITFRNGFAQYGAGLYTYYTTPTVRRCVFENCVANSGGAVYCNDSSQEPEYARFEQCTFVGNSAVNGGSAFYASYSSPTLSNCTFIDNDGSGVKCVFAPAPQLTNCLIVGSEVGVYCYESSPILTNCTITDNIENGVFVSVAGEPKLTNCIVWDGGISLSGVFAIATATFSDIEGSWPGVGNINSDPLFVSYRGFDYLLGPGSPAIDAGDPSIEDGVSDSHPRWPRRYPNDARSDMGAYGGPKNGRMVQ